MRVEIGLLTFLGCCSFVTSESNEDITGIATLLTSTQGLASDTFSQGLAIHRFLWEAVCIYNSGVDGRKEWTYIYKKSECDNTTGDPKLVKITCAASYIALTRGPRTRWAIADKSFTDHCPENTRCVQIELPNPSGQGPTHEAGCADLDDITEETVYDNQYTSQPNHETVHCGLSLQLPGSQYSSNAHQQPLDIILTEEVRKKDGTPYKASELYIVDTTNAQRRFSPAYRTEADVASALVEIPVYRGRLQQRTYEFCMKMAPGHLLSSVIFAYSFLQVPHNFGRVPLQMDEKHAEITEH